MQPQSQPKINLIVAYDKFKGIAKKNTIPWKIQSDMNFFMDVTKRPSTQDPTSPNVVIMGRNTWQAIPSAYRGLAGRINIVVSSTMTVAELDASNTCRTIVYLAKSVADAIDICCSKSTADKLGGDIFICGGAQIYSEAMAKFEIFEYYLTEINHDYQADVFFPYDLMDTKTNYLLRKSNSFKVKDLISDTIVDINFSVYQINKQNQHTNTPNTPTITLNQSTLNTPTINLPEHQYLSLLSDILTNGQFVSTRNANTWSLFGRNLEFDLSKGFPLLTTKRVFFRGVCEELFFFLNGYTDTNKLSDIGINIWKANTSEEFLNKCNLPYKVGDMGPMYGFNLLHFGAKYNGCDCESYQGFDQIAYCLNLLKTDPYSRRIIMTTFNPAVASEGVLYPCHGITIMFGVQLSGDRYALNCMMSQRSADAVCGIPFNIASYALLVHLFCEVINNDIEYTGNKFVPGRLVMNLGDVHIYESHHTQAIRQILRDPYEFPTIRFRNTVTTLTGLKMDDIELVDYKCWPAISATMVA